MLRIYLVVLSLFISFATMAQYGKTISADRPGQALTAYTVGQGIFQVQFGFDHFGSSSAANKSSGFLNNTVLRYGITEQFEINSQFEYKGEQFTQKSDGSTSNQQGVSATDIGIRYHIYTGKGHQPSVAFQFGTRLPVLGTAYKIENIAPRFLLVTNQSLSNLISLNTVWGAAWNGNNNIPKYNYVINLSFALSERLGVFAENYGSTEGGVFTTYFDGGASWLLTNDLQIGLNGGMGSNEGVTSYFVSAGVSWRTKRKQ